MNRWASNTLHRRASSLLHTRALMSIWNCTSIANYDARNAPQQLQQRDPALYVSSSAPEIDLTALRDSVIRFMMNACHILRSKSKSLASFMARNRKDRLYERRSFVVGLVRRILQRIAGGDLDPYEGYRQVEAIYLDNSGLVEELKTFLDLPGMASKEHIVVDQTFRDQVVASAERWLMEHHS